MKKPVFVALAVVLILFDSTFGRIYNRCSLAKEMHRLGVPKDQLARWTCIAKHESKFNSKAVGSVNSNGSRDYGIFQINNKYWCKSSSSAFSHNQCNIKCEDFLVDNIASNVKCARMVQQKQGWKAWSTFKFCNANLPSINNCF